MANSGVRLLSGNICFSRFLAILLICRYRFVGHFFLDLHRLFSLSSQSGIVAPSWHEAQPQRVDCRRKALRAFTTPNCKWIELLYEPN